MTSREPRRLQRVAPGNQAALNRQSVRETREIAASLVAARKRAQMTQVEVAQAMDTTQSVIATLESGRSSPRLSTLQRFARATGSALRLSLPPAPEPQPHPDPRHPAMFLQALASRRSVLGSAVGLAAAAVALQQPVWAQTPEAAGVATPVAAQPSNGTQPDGSWVFTDDRGITVRLPQAPARVFANLNAAAPLTDFGVTLVGTYANIIPPDDPTWGSVDRSLPNLVSGEMLDVEGLVGLQPDLFVAVTWDPSEPYWIWGIEEGSYDLVNGIVPIICISTQGDPAESIGRFEALAGALGANLDTPKLVAARGEFQAAIDSLAQVATDKPDLSVLFAYIPAEGDWLAAVTRDWPELEMYERLGVNIVSGAEPENTYWESISRENALLHPADVLMSSAFVESYRLEDLQEDPIFSRRPEVQAGQVGMWRSDFIMSYQGMTEPMQQFAALLRESSPVT